MTKSVRFSTPISPATMLPDATVPLVQAPAVAGVFEGTVPTWTEAWPADHARVSALAGKLAAEGATVQQHALGGRVQRNGAALIKAANRVRNGRGGTKSRARFERNVTKVIELLVSVGGDGVLTWDALRDYTRATQAPSSLRDALWQSFGALGGATAATQVEVRRDAAKAVLHALWAGDSAAKRAIARL